MGDTIDARSLGAWSRTPFGGTPTETDVPPDEEAPVAGVDLQTLGETVAEKSGLLLSVVQAHLPNLTPDTAPDEDLATRVLDAASDMDANTMGSALEIAGVAQGATLDDCLTISDAMAQGGTIDPVYADAVGTFIYYLANVLTPSDDAEA
jgi:hypothetical protein